MAPIIAIGSSALVAGSAGTAGATVKKASPTITIVDAVPGAFRFLVNGSVVSLKNQRGVFAGKVGVNHVSEVSAPALFRTLSSISVSPPAARVSSSLKLETVSLKLAAGGAAIVKFANSKLVVKVTSAPAAPVTPPPSSPAPSSPAPSAGNSGGGSSGGSGGVTDPTTPPPAGDGYIEICKSAVDGYVEGTFNFTILGTTYPLTLTPTGTSSLPDTAPQVCTGAIAVPAGTVTVTEGLEAPAYALEALVGVSAYPVDALTAENLATGTATFTVTAGFETTGVFLNVTQENFIKVCKVLANNLGTLAGTPFSYTVNWTFTPPTKNLTFSSYSGTEQVVVVAVAAPGQQCSVVPYPIPAGSTVWVTENGAEVAGGVASGSAPYVSVSDVSITPSTFDAATATTPSTEAVLTVPPVGDGLADATFTNTPMGTIEVCKYFVSPYSAYNNGINSATFIVTAGSFTSAPFTVLGGECSPAMIVPAGTATVQETSASSVINGVDESADYYLENITATATVSGLSGGSQNELTSVGTANPASVNVLYGGVASETAVTFTNGVDPTHFKICKQTTSPQLVGAQFTFFWSYKGAIHPLFLLPEGGTVSLTIKAVATPVCSDLLTDIPVVNPDGSSNPITVLEEAATENVIATAVTLSGAGTVVGIPSVPTDPDTSACLTFDPGYGISIVTFTNEYYPSPV
jgi:hypothetical protein